MNFDALSSKAIVRLMLHVRESLVANIDDIQPLGALDDFNIGILTKMNFEHGIKRAALTDRCRRRVLGQVEDIGGVAFRALPMDAFAGLAMIGLSSAVRDANLRAQ